MQVTDHDRRTATGAVAAPAQGRGRRLRVLWAIKGLGRGGAEQLLVSLARVADHDRFRYDACFLLPHKDLLVDELAAAGVTVHPLAGRGGPPARGRLVGRLGGWRWPWRLRRLLATGRYDVVHTHSPVLAAAVRLAAVTLPRARRPATVYTQHNVWQSYSRGTRLAEGMTHRLDRHRFAVSSSVTGSNPARLRDSTELLVHGVVAAGGSGAGGATARAAGRALLGLPDDVPLVVTVANLRATKDHATLLEAARLVHASLPEVRFAVVGDGPLRADLESRAVELRVDGVVSFLGTRDDVDRLLPAADLFVLSSRHEGLPIAMMEAMAAGVACVLTRVGGIPDVVDDGRDALLVPPADPAALAAAISALCTDPARRRALGECARSRSGRFDITTAARGYERVYEEVTG